MTRYSRLGASSRVRTYQYFEYLRARGCEVVEAPLFDDAYLEALYHGRRRSISAVLAGYAWRVARLAGRSGYDVVWAEIELLPWLPFGIESLILKSTQRCVMDFDDAVFHRYDRHRRSVVRRLLGTKIARVMRRADTVVAGSHYIADYARDAGAKRIELLPTVVDLERYPLRDSRPARGRIGWIGTPLTARRYLPVILPALQALAANREFTFVSIGAGDVELPGVRTESHEWLAATEGDLLETLDIGVMPLEDGPWEQGKCGYKLIQYMACGLPVVASKVGENPYIVHHGEHGFLVDNQDDWVEALGHLLDDQGRARVMGLAGRARVEAQFSTRVSAPRLYDILRDAAGATCAG